MIIKTPISEFINSHFTCTKAITVDANRQLRASPMALPKSTQYAYPFAAIGSAIEYRIMFSLAKIPIDQLNAYRVIRGFWVGPEITDDPIPRHRPSRELLQAFSDSLEKTLARLKPIGRRLGRDSERLLASYCVVLGFLDGVTRLGDPSNGPLYSQHAPRRSIEELLAIAGKECLQDMVQLIEMFYESCKDWWTQSITLSPVFPKEPLLRGDVIVGDCLYDIKTSKNPSLNVKWLRQMARYILINDSYQINRIGLYLVRQGVSFSWDIEEFFILLTGDKQASIPSLRQEYLAVIDYMRSDEWEQRLKEIISQSRITRSQ